MVRENLFEEVSLGERVLVVCCSHKESCRLLSYSGSCNTKARVIRQFERLNERSN